MNINTIMSGIIASILLVGLCVVPAAAEPRPDLPETWCIGKPRPPIVHLAKGLWWNYFGWNEAMIEWGAMYSSSYNVSIRRGRSGSVRNFPATGQDLMRFNLVMVANIGAASFGPSGQRLLEDYVMNGGALFVFGGLFAFEGGGAFEGGSYAGSAFERLLPCRMLGTERVKAPGGLVLKLDAAGKDIVPADLGWALEPRVYYYHELLPKEGAKVLAVIAGKPALMVWKVGRGRVAAFGVSPEGEPGEGQLAFWEWGDLPRLLAAVCQWLTTGQGEQPPTPVSAQTRKLLAQAESLAPGADEDAKRARVMQMLFAECRDRGFAKDLLTAVSDAEGTPDRIFVETAAIAVHPYVDGGFEQTAMGLIASGNTGKASLGLQVLGMSRAPGALATALKFLNEKTNALKRGKNSDELSISSLMTEARGSAEGDDQRLELAAVMALGSLGDPAGREPLVRLCASLADQPPGASEASDMADLRECIIQQALASRIRLGDGKAVGPFLDAMLKNAAQVDVYRNALDEFLVNPKNRDLMYRRKMAPIRLPLLSRRQELCLNAIRACPASVYPEIVAELVRRNAPRLTSYAVAMLTPYPGQTDTVDVVRSLLPLVAKCQIPELRLMAFNRVRQIADAQAQKEMGALMVRLAAGMEQADAVFALRRVSRLAPADRAGVIAAALNHADAGVRKLALGSAALLPEPERLRLIGK